MDHHLAPLRRSSTGRLAAAVAFLVLLSACASTASPIGSRGSGPPASSVAVASTGACGTVKLAVNPWVGYEADVAVVGYLLRHQLGCRVLEEQLDEPSAWQSLASGQVDVILENWDHQDLQTQYITREGTVRDAGPTGNEGVIGWYAPRFFVDANPAILTATSDPQVLNRYAAQFRTAASGAKGQLLEGDPGFVTQDRAMIEGFGLDYAVVYAGSEGAAHQAIAAAIAQRTPILAYYYEPNWYSTKVDLVHIALPPFTPGCNSDPAKIACDYPRYELDKLVSARFAASGGPAYELIRRFHWSNQDQDLVAADIEGGMADELAAAKWLAANPATWQAWLPR